MKSGLNLFNVLKAKKNSAGSARKAPRLNMEALEERQLLTLGSIFGPFCAPSPCPKPAPAPTPAPTPTAYTGVLAGTVFNDLNGNGVLDRTDSYIKGATVSLYKAGSCKVVQSVTTGANGQYAFTSLAPGNYSIVQCAPSGYKAQGTDLRAGLNTATAVNIKTISATVVDPTQVVAMNGGDTPGQFTVVNVNLNGTSTLTNVGTLNSSLGTSYGANNLNNGFTTFCVDANTAMSPTGGESYRVDPQLISELSNGTSKISADHSGRIAYLFNHYGSAAVTSTEGAALQLAVWELLYDDDADLTQGNFSVDTTENDYTDQATLDTVLAESAAFLNESIGKSETAIVLNANTYNSGGIGYQSVLVSNSLNFADRSVCSTSCGSTSTSSCGPRGDSLERLAGCISKIKTASTKGSCYVVNTSNCGVNWGSIFKSFLSNSKC